MSLSRTKPSMLSTLALASWMLLSSSELEAQEQKKPDTASPKKKSTALEGFLGEPESSQVRDLAKAVKPHVETDIESFIAKNLADPKVRVAMFGRADIGSNFFNFWTKSNAAESLAKNKFNHIFLEYTPVGEKFGKVFFLQEMLDIWFKDKEGKLPDDIKHLLADSEWKNGLIEFLESLKANKINPICMDYKGLVKFLHGRLKDRAKIKYSAEEVIPEIPYLERIPPKYRLAIEKWVEKLVSNPKSPITRDALMGAIALEYLGKDSRDKPSNKIAIAAGSNHVQEADTTVIIPQHTVPSRRGERTRRAREEEPLGEQLTKFLGKGSIDAGKDKVFSMGIGIDLPKESDSTMRAKIGFQKGNRIFFDLSSLLSHTGIFDEGGALDFRTKEVLESLKKKLFQAKDKNPWRRVFLEVKDDGSLVHRMFRSPLDKEGEARVDSTYISPKG